MPAPRGNVDALVWRRSDLRETSRLVTLLTREHGRLVTLAKGAHRPNSVLLGRIDLLNRVDAELAGRGFPILSKVTLRHEPRALRHPGRYPAVARLVELLDAVWLPEQPDPELFDLTTGSIALIERAPLASLDVVLAGVESRLLAFLGAWVDPRRCSICDAPLSGGVAFVDGMEGGVRCAEHVAPHARRADPLDLAWLAELAERPGREWPGLGDDRRSRPARRALQSWLERALERRLVFDRGARPD